MTAEEQVYEKCRELIVLSRNLYGVNLDRASIEFNLKGRCLGYAWLKGNQFGVKFNGHMLTTPSRDKIISRTVAHEIAHLICFLRPELGNGHDLGWKNICIALGGDGETYHDEPVLYGRGKTYEFVTSTKDVVRIGDKYFEHLKRLGRLEFKNKGFISASCKYKVVGISGKPVGDQCTHNAADMRSARTQATTEPPVFKAAQPAHAGQAVHKQLSKMEQTRQIVADMYARGSTCDKIIQEIITKVGFDKSRAKATYRACAKQLGIPEKI